ncbi:hypothetical protein FQA39_LY05087 [Lamprigera yunnana]|nr:hypothetical protein FQA39_LY05087 [Lamprigera yunnana]
MIVKPQVEWLAAEIGFRGVSKTWRTAPTVLIGIVIFVIAGSEGPLEEVYDWPAPTKSGVAELNEFKPLVSIFIQNHSASECVRLNSRLMRLLTPINPDKCECVATCLRFFENITETNDSLFLNQEVTDSEQNEPLANNDRVDDLHFNNISTTQPNISIIL